MGKKEVKITKSRLRQIIKEEASYVIEAPIVGFEYETGGNQQRFDPEKGRGGFRKKDRKLLMNPKAVQKIKKKWEKTPFDFNIYLLQVAALNKPEYREYGRVDPGTSVSTAIRLALGGSSLEKLEDFPVGSPERVMMIKNSPLLPNMEDGITILFNGNYGADKVPLTAWMMAHRISHAVARPSGGYTGKRTPEYQKFIDSVNYMFKEIVKPYGAGENLSMYSPWPTGGGYRDYGKQASAERTYAYIANQIGTMKSARDNRIDRVTEFYHELFAQYLLTGKITFKKLPRSLVTKRGSYGHEERTYARYEDYLEDTNELLQQSAVIIGDRIQEVLESMVGNTYLM